MHFSSPQFGPYFLILPPLVPKIKKLFILVPTVIILNEVGCRMYGKLRW